MKIIINKPGIIELVKICDDYCCKELERNFSKERHSKMTIGIQVSCELNMRTFFLEYEYCPYCGSKFNITKANVDYMIPILPIESELVKRMKDE